jgi:hypothetical protein
MGFTLSFAFLGTQKLNQVISIFINCGICDIQLRIQLTLSQLAQVPLLPFCYKVNM